MNTAKILADVCKTFLNEKRLMVGDYDDQFVGVSTDGFVLYLLKQSEFPFDRATLLRGRSQVDLKNVIPAESAAAVLTDEMMKKDIRTVRKVTDGNLNVWIDTKFLKNFDKCATFQITGEKSGVLVYESEKLAGMILPVRI